MIANASFRWSLGLAVLLSPGLVAQRDPTPQPKGVSAGEGHAEVRSELFGKPVSDHDTRTWEQRSIAFGRAQVQTWMARRRLPERTAIRRGLDWLAAHQADDGGFPDTEAGALRATSAAMLAFACYGCGPVDGLHADTVRRGLTWLVDQQRADGWIGAPAQDDDDTERVRAHALATLVLVDTAWAGNFPQFREHALSALRVLVASDSTEPWREVAVAYGLRSGILEHDRPRTRSAPSPEDRDEAAVAIVAAYLRAVDRRSPPTVPRALVDATLELVDDPDTDPATVVFAMSGLYQLGGPTWQLAARRYADWIGAQRPDGSWAAAEDDEGSASCTAMRVLALDLPGLFVRFGSGNGTQATRAREARSVPEPR